ncbi:MAG: transposase [Fusicatenibacter saccharivorans]
MHMVYYFYEERSHLLVDCRPQFYISDMIKIMKGNLARQMFLLHPELKKELWGEHL